MVEQNKREWLSLKSFPDSSKVCGYDWEVPHLGRLLPYSQTSEKAENFTEKNTLSYFATEYKKVFIPLTPVAYVIKLFCP
jgi:hypothetical protein